MTYLYHIVPDNFYGDKILPLSSLLLILEKDKINSENNLEKSAKIITNKVDYLDCTLADVIFLSLISPKELDEEQSLRVGKSLKGQKFFKIPLSILDEENLVYYRTTDPFKENRFIRFSGVKEYYKHFTKEDRDIWYLKHHNNPTVGSCLFDNTYQVLYKGAIDIKDIEIIEV